MNAATDHQLLRAYAVLRDEAAFRELVQRHTDFIYSAALRQVNSDATARDLTQSVFTDLARRAPDILGRHTGDSLAGWLHRATRYAALNHLRDARRRHDNERQAMEQLLTNSESAADWEQIRPVLDEALDALDDTDREALLLRYFKNHDFRTVGQQLGVSDDAAQKRVSRAVERLREFFAKRGVSVGAGGLVVVISANAVQAAPVGLAVTISAAALAGTAATTSTLIAATTKTIAMTTLQKTLVTATVAVLAGAGIYEARQAAELREQNQTLQQHQKPLAEQVKRLQTELEAAKNRTANLSEELARGAKDKQELLGLRGKLGVLQNQLAEAKRQSTQTPQLPATSGRTWGIRETVPRTKWTNAGQATPQAAVETFCWAVASNDQIQFGKIALNHDGSAMAQDIAAKNLWFRNFEMNSDSVESMRLVSVSQNDEESAIVSIELLGRPKGSSSDSLTPNEMQLRLRRNDGNWQIDVDRDRVQMSAQHNPAETADFLSKLKLSISNNAPQTVSEILEKSSADKQP